MTFKWTETDQQAYIDDLFDCLATVLQEQETAMQADNHDAFMQTVRPIGGLMMSLEAQGFTLEEITAAIDSREER